MTVTGAASHAPSATIETLRRRGELLNRVRTFLVSRGYWEVETPLLSHDVGVDAHLEPFAQGVGGGTMYLQTSPEFAMKRLLAAGAGSIFQITRSFRGGEAGPLHNPEFTIVEWYRVGGTYHALMTEVGEFVAETAGWPVSECVNYREAFRRWAEIDPASAPNADLQALANHHGFSGRATDRDGLLNFLLAALVEPNLGRERPLLLFDYPVSQSALARVRNDGDFAWAERFELYYRGVELANGFQELTDAAELRRRNREQNRRRAADGRSGLPEESRLLAAMEAGLPESAGVALGFDRFAMLTLGCTNLDQVLAFPISRA